MKTRKTILKQRDVIQLTGIDINFPVCDLRAILNIELKEFRECLGKAFYEKLKADLNVFEPVAYDKDKTYGIGEVVLFKGHYYQAIKETGALPTVHTDWQKAPRFKSECLEFLWCNFLGEYLSWAVLKIRLPFIATQLKDGTLGKVFGDKLRVADSEDYRAYTRAIDRMISIVFENMDDYMKSNNEDGCFDEYKGIAVGCCGDCGCKEEACVCESGCVNAKKSKHRLRIG